MSWVGTTDPTGAVRVNVVNGGDGGVADLVTIAGPIPLPVSGSVSVLNLPVTQPISGAVAVNNFPPSQLISGTVAVNNYPPSQAVTGSVAVTNLPAQQTVKFPDALTDANSRLRVSTPTTMFATQMQYDLSPQFMEAGATGDGIAPVFDTNVKGALISSGAGTGTSFMQSYRHVPYQAGKGQQTSISFILGTSTVGATKDIGRFDGENGIFLRQSGSGVSFVRRSSATGSLVDTEITQANWSIDKFDGTGPSGIILDPTRAQILLIDIQFLGGGRTRVGFDIGGETLYAHEFLCSNVLSVPYFQTATLPIQLLLTATGTGAASSFLYTAAAILIEGVFDRRPESIFSTRNITVTAGSGVQTHLFSIRPSLLFKGITNRTTFLLRQLNMLIAGSSPVFYEMSSGVVFGTQPTWSVISANSAFEIGVGGTLSVVPTPFESGYLAASAQSKGSAVSSFVFTNPVNLNRAGQHRPEGIITIVVTGIGGTSATHGSMDFEEYH